MNTKDELYKEYSILVVPKYKRQSNLITISITISKVTDGKIKDKVFVTDPNVVNEDEALNIGVQHGKDIIDGKINGYSIEF